MKTIRLLSVLLIAFGLLLATLLSLLYVSRVSLAQSGQIIITKRLNRATNVVRVGEVLSFTIALTNNAGFTLTNVTLVDSYNNNVLAFAGAISAADLHNPTTGVITWSNVAAPPIPANGSLTFTVFFTAEHPQPTVVNYVRAQDITGTGQAISDALASDQIDEAIGGAAPIFKATSPPTAIPQVGLPVTFTHRITNDGAAIMTVLPLTDTYDPAFLEFNFAIPSPTITSPPGLLVWTDLTTYFGDLTPFETVVVTTVFTATTQIIGTVNQASTEGARDEYNNDLSAGSALIPITIIGNSSGDDSGEDSKDDSSHDDDDDNAPAPTPTQTTIETPTPVATAFIAPTATAPLEGQAAITGSNVPRYLPETGYISGHNFKTVVFLLMLLFVLLLVGYLPRKRRL